MTTPPERREVTVDSSLAAHQLKQYLMHRGLTYGSDGLVFHITAHVETWMEIDEWLERIKVKS